MDLLHGALGADEDQALEIAVAHALLRGVSRGDSGAVLRVYRPTAPVVAFSRRDSHLPGFDAAVRAARDAGFQPLVRPQGGRAVAYTEQSVVVDHVSPHPDFPAGLNERFTDYGHLWADVLREHGVDARVGAVPGEYCPGAYSVNARGVVKLVGTAQRLVRQAWLFSAVAIFDGAEVLRPLLTEIYAHLGLDFDGSSVGSVREEVPDLDLERFESAVIASYGALTELTPTALDDGVVSAAHDLAVDHRL
ncbi:lipoate-protein ligase A [Saccharopolyspora erythraea NRRL 2338]|uniref:Possible lipoate-protein ligase A n=2 Tax=Saccharopolyspora erythraea TaxID=1836 RepID=A4FEF4_SACEN|nr:lipoate--protein ligase family protein [Saccharopolyspora erythraea]EQD83668.1 lipoate--protein ligase [Saccharopolyspora erythraea D]PFG96154.1 lipoate-protein ligase A [Saccharopolyspora erythraea NRRL 2338]QRK92690.1 lipoate--protein ligase family protein [Saccharopolyspora erythraea]CAM02429.1 possible lipoate-protein ligase A [Saccharopolyspora erythraea NRRL 2338]